MPFSFGYNYFRFSLFIKQRYFEKQKGPGNLYSSLKLGVMITYNEFMGFSWSRKKTSEIEYENISDSVQHDIETALKRKACVVLLSFNFTSPRFSILIY